MIYKREQHRNHMQKKEGNLYLIIITYKLLSVNGVLSKFSKVVIHSATGKLTVIRYLLSAKCQLCKRKGHICQLGVITSNSDSVIEKIIVF